MPPKLEFVTVDTSPPGSIAARADPAQEQRASLLLDAVCDALMNDNRDASLWLPPAAAERLALGSTSHSHPFDLCLAAAQCSRADALAVLFDMGYAPRPEPGSSHPCADEWRNLLVLCAGKGLCDPIARLAAITPIDTPHPDHGVTALMLAAAHGRAEAALLLLRLGADPHARSHLGRTALMSAAKMGCAPIIEALLAIGADPYETDAKGDNALDLARRERPQPFLSLLEAFELSGCVPASAPQRRPSL